MFYVYSFNIFVLAFVSQCGFFYIFSMDKCTRKMSLCLVKLSLSQFLKSSLVNKEMHLKEQFTEKKL